MTERPDLFAAVISAVGALGGLGGPEQTALLEDLVNGPEPRLKGPAQQALKQIQNRQRLAVAQGKS